MGVNKVKRLTDSLKELGLILIAMLIKILVVYSLWDDIMVLHFGLGDITLTDSFFICIFASLLLNRNSQNVNMSNTQIKKIINIVKEEK